MTIGLALKTGLGVVCFALGAACLIAAICIVVFISASDAAVPGMFAAFGAIFLLIAYLMLRRVRRHND
jgi:tellurite resistance protein TehA-like permease